MYLLETVVENVLILSHCNFYVIYYYRMDQDCRKIVISFLLNDDKLGLQLTTRWAKFEVNNRKGGSQATMI